MTTQANNTAPRMFKSMIQKNFICLACVIVLSACQKEDTHVQLQFKEPVYTDVDFEFVPIEGMPDYFYGFGACVLGQNLLIYENTPYRRYHLVDLNKRQLIRTFGQEDGPYKVNYPYCNDQLISHGDSLFTILHDGGREHIVLDLSEHRNKHGFSYKKLDVPEDVVLTNPVYLSKDGEKVFGFSSAKPGVFSYDLPTRKTTLISVGPDLKFNTDPVTRSNIFFAATAWNPDESLFAVAFNYFNRIELYDSDLQITRSISIGRPKLDIPETEDGAPIGSVILYASHILIGKENLYVLYFNEELNNADKVEAQKVLIINLKENTIQGIRVPAKLTSLSLDPEENYLFGTVEDDTHKEGNLIRINISAFSE